MDVVTNDPLRCTIAHSALSNVYDPEIGLNVIDLGLIYQLDFDNATEKIFCSMTLTTAFCPMGESIRDGVVQALRQVFPGYTVKVDVIFEPPWSYENISEEGRSFLNR